MGDKIAVVAGATRGAGRGIARVLGEGGALVYCTGRSVRGNPSPYGRTETIEETAELIAQAGGPLQFGSITPWKRKSRNSLRASIVNMGVWM